MVGGNQHDIGGGNGLVRIGDRPQPSVVHLDLRNVGVDVVDVLRAVLGKQFHHLQGRAVAQIVHVPLEGHAQHQNAGILQRHRLVGNLPHHHLPHVERHGLVHLGRQRDEVGHEVVAAGHPAQIIGIDQDAVSADSRTGPEGHEPERLGGGGLHHLPDVHSHPVAQLRQFVHQRDVHRAEDILQQLFHLRHFRRGDLMHRLDNHSVGGGGNRRAFRRYPSHNNGRICRMPRLVSRIDPLRREGEVKILPHLQSALLQNGKNVAFGRVRERSAFQDHTLILPKMGRDRFRGVHYIGDVGILVRRERSGNADVDNVRIGNDGGIGLGNQQAPFHGVAHDGVVQILDVVPPLAEHIHLPPVHIDADRLDARPGKFHGQRKPHIAQAEDGNRKLTRLNTFEKIHTESKKERLFASLCCKQRLRYKSRY